MIANLQFNQTPLTTVDLYANQRSFLTKPFNTEVGFGALINQLKTHTTKFCKDVKPKFLKSSSNSSSCTCFQNCKRGTSLPMIDLLASGRFPSPDDNLKNFSNPNANFHFTSATHPSIDFGSNWTTSWQPFDNRSGIENPLQRGSREPAPWLASKSESVRVTGYRHFKIIEIGKRNSRWWPKEIEHLTNVAWSAMQNGDLAWAVSCGFHIWSHG